MTQVTEEGLLQSALSIGCVENNLANFRDLYERERT